MNHNCGWPKKDETITLLIGKSFLTNSTATCWRPSISNCGRNTGDFLSKFEASTRSSRSFGSTKDIHGAAFFHATSDASNRNIDSPTMGIHAMFPTDKCLSESVFSINRAAVVNIELCPAILAVYSDSLCPARKPDQCLKANELKEHTMYQISLQSPNIVSLCCETVIHD